MLHLLSSWFNPGFLQMRRVDWNSPAQLLEQIIRHEAVHEIDGWDDLRRRLQPDRRCFAFFHPQLPDEPLIFVEVALLPEMPSAIAPLIDKASHAAAAEQFKVAAFYSISNCQPGLRGVSLGNFLIKRVAEELQRELPQLQDLLHAVADPRLRALAARRRGLSTACRKARAERAGAGARGAARGLRRRPRRAGRAPPRCARCRRRRSQALLRLAALYLALHRHRRRRRPGGALPPRQRRAAGAAEPARPTCRPKG